MGRIRGEDGSEEVERVDGHMVVLSWRAFII